MNLSPQKDTISISSAIHAQILTIVNAFHSALIDGDTKSMETVLSSEFSYGDGSGNIFDKDVFLQKTDNGAITFSEIEIIEQSIQVTYNTAVARFSFLVKIGEQDTKAQEKVKSIMVLHKYCQNWKLLAIQTIV